MKIKEAFILSAITKGKRKPRESSWANPRKTARKEKPPGFYYIKSENKGKLIC